MHSAAGLPLPHGLVSEAPFRAPHHSASMAALVGGGSGSARPGEVSAASNGVLFLDELGEFAPSVLDALRQPLEEGVVRVARARGTTEQPARVLLVETRAEAGLERFAQARRSSGESSRERAY